MHDDAPPHYVLIIHKYLDMAFGEWIGKHGAVEWLARSCDMTPSDFFWEGRLLHGVCALFSSCRLTSKRSSRIFTQISKWWSVRTIRWSGGAVHALLSADITLRTSNNHYKYSIHTFFRVSVFFLSCKLVAELMPHPV